MLIKPHTNWKALSPRGYCKTGGMLVLSCVHAGNLHPPDAHHNVLNCLPWQACDSAEDAQFVQKFAVSTAVLQLRGVLWVSFLTLDYKVDSCLAVHLNHEL